MTKDEKMTATKDIKDYIEKIPEGESFSSHALRPFATTETIRQILSRLVKKGQLKRVARGVFIKPKHLPTVGDIPPSASAVAKTLAELTNEIIAIHGAEAARQLQLTTQVPMRLIFYTNGNTRTLQIANRTVTLKHVNPSQLIAAGTTAGTIISALHYLGRKNVTLKTIDIIRNNVSEEEFKETLHLIEQMPAWMSDTFYRYQKEKNNGS